MTTQELKSEINRLQNRGELTQLKSGSEVRNTAYAIDRVLIHIRGCHKRKEQAYLNRDLYHDYLIIAGFTAVQAEGIIKGIDIFFSTGEL